MALVVMDEQELKQVAYVLYNVDGPALWHQRWFLGTVASSPGRAVWAFPDGGVQYEVTDETNTDISSIRWAAV